MANPTKKTAHIREAVASFADREHFGKAVAELLAAGFASGDLSVLASHVTIAAADASKEARSWLPSSLADEIKYIGPLTVAGIVVLSGGPVAAGIAALVAAGLGGAALKEILDRYTTRHTAEFAAALKAGAVLLWVRCENEAQEQRAMRILEAAGGRHGHIHQR
ncbi:MAG: hypothetical protein JO255_20610 [Alphaproteobacteria bacterium]|nr:hypothetical protein [Alphaproteobacteria bacterium]